MPQAAVIQRARRRQKRDDDDMDWEPPPPSEKQERYGHRKGTQESVIRATAHQVVNFDKDRFGRVWTCRGCQRMLAYEDQDGEFDMTDYNYISKAGNEHKIKAIALDHHHPWAGRLRAMKQRGATKEEIRADYQNLYQLRALCTVCNSSHQFEEISIGDYDSEDSQFERASTPPREWRLNPGAFTEYRDPDSMDQ